MARARFIVGLTVLLSACETPDGDGDAEVPEGCECIPNETQEEWGPASWPTCGAQLCPIVVASGSEYGNPFVLTNPEALDCALTALRDRSPGVVRWSWEESAGQFSDEGYILVQPEGTAVHRRWGAEDLSWRTSAARAGELPSAQFYEDCLTQTDAEVRFDCLREPPVVLPTLCDEGWLVSSI